MQRRQFITSASATVAAASIAGCSGILGGGGGGNSGPDGPVKAYASAVSNNNADELQSLAHPDANESTGELSDSDLEGISMNVKSTEVLEQSDGQATVEAEIETTVTMMGEEQSQTQTIEFDVRKHDGEWLIYDSETVSTGGN
ncbi:hypothetical protein L593_07350 [Salinarchaeum sp. Harcht-Bsk1]|uniref:hypothetical protein n=1 Tax=Salinarchaeum sp. Harcht-Bsk1 TaxID=1333523 RepID=UPI00034248B8|nr:hypothetical protein [Salinarchaeum sp. Harcht-Bsk1]AGN01415.1 hypothetical protein L593_07350 [Salinarchaeum sp. Harcht-Bsk1]